MLFLICSIFVMSCIAIPLYYIGRKVSYSFLLYNPAITLSVGICLYLVKIQYNLSQNNSLFIFDVTVLSILLVIWIFAVIEAVIIDIFEQSNEMKNDMKTIINKIYAYLGLVGGKVLSNAIIQKFKAYFLFKFPLKMEDGQKENNGS